MLKRRQAPFTRLENFSHLPVSHIFIKHSCIKYVTTSGLVHQLGKGAKKNLELNSSLIVCITVVLHSCAHFTSMSMKCAPMNLLHLYTFNIVTANQQQNHTPSLQRFLDAERVSTPWAACLWNFVPAPIPNHSNMKKI